MSEVKDIPEISFAVEEFEPVWIVGKETTVEQGKTASKFVKQYRTDGSAEELLGLNGRVSPDGDMIIWMGEYDSVRKCFTELVGVFSAPECAVKEGYSFRILPRCTMGVCTIKGKTRDITRGAHNKLVKEAAKAGYLPDYSYGYSLEYYSHVEYELDNDVYTFRYMLPCRLK